MLLHLARWSTRCAKKEDTNTIFSCHHEHTVQLPTKTHTNSAWFLLVEGEHVLLSVMGFMTMKSPFGRICINVSNLTGKLLTSTLLPPRFYAFKHRNLAFKSPLNTIPQKRRTSSSLKGCGGNSEPTFFKQPFFLVRGTRWWFLFFSSLLGEMIQFDSFFSDGLKPPSMR